MACSLGISMQVGIAARHHNHRRSDSAGTSEAMSVGVPQVEEKLINDEIDGTTYKKWVNRYSQDKAVLNEQIEQTLNSNDEKELTKLIQFLPKVTGLKNLYKEMPLNRKQALIKGVFKLDLTYFDGKFRTPYIEPAFARNALIAKEKGLLEIEESYNLRDKIPSSSP
ncbi:hypothetical protein [Parapedobacter sp. 2B3]|uniref:hypothetical protein n=1 Tax=Parapedobacter sp. 2B3 TaxID=3342381 RepID=UPI0035B635A8